MKKSLTFTRKHLGYPGYHSDASKHRVTQVLSAIQSGGIKGPIEGICRLDNMTEMIDALNSRKTAGKLIVRTSA